MLRYDIAFLCLSDGLTFIRSTLAQRKRDGPITHRSLDRNQQVLIDGICHRSVFLLRPLLGEKVGVHVPQNPCCAGNASSMAQLVERMAVNHKVRGSNPRGGVFYTFGFVPNTTR